MDEIIEIKGYRDFKAELDKELKANAEGFVKIGYLLKVARDTSVLTESGYKNVAEFAQAEYGLSKDVVSRYIAINDRYSEDGYSMRLQDRFEGYGVAKLQEMLTLSDAVIEAIEPTLTRKEIQEIKKEVAEEEAITPLEVIAEAAAPENVKEEKELTLTQRIWKAYFHEAKDEFLKIAKVIDEEATMNTKATFCDWLAPTGCANKWARIPGVGKFMMTIRSKSEPITLTNVRDGSRIEQKLEEVIADLQTIFMYGRKEEWSSVYGEPFDAPAEAPSKKEEPKAQPKPVEVKKPEVAPVQPKKEYEPPVLEEIKLTDSEYKEIVSDTAENKEPVTEPIINAPEEPDNTEPTKVVEAAVVEEAKQEVQTEAAVKEKNDNDILPKVEGEVVRAEQPKEYKIVQKMLDTVQFMRRILSEHVSEDDAKMSETDVRIIKESVQDITELMDQFEKGRGRN